MLREYQKRKIEVQTFLERDDKSKVCPGSKDTRSRAGKIKRTRYLSDTMENLHKKYNEESNIKLSYTTFTRFRPFWVIEPKLKERDTSLVLSMKTSS